MRRQVQWAALLALVAGTATPAQAEQAEQAHDAQVAVDVTAFSPNGDGVRDRAAIRFTLPTASTVSVRLTKLSGEHLMQARLGRLSAGTHAWRWDGRVRGRRMPHGFYRVHLRTGAGVETRLVSLDLRFEARVYLANDFGRAPSSVPTVYPRTRVVRDAIGLLAFEEEVRGTRAVLHVRDEDGAVVARRNLLEDPLGELVDGAWRTDPEMWAARDARDRPLPPGLYEATVRGTDAVGNRGVSRPLVIRVSARRLAWVDETRHVVPDDVDHNALCGDWYDTNGCPDSIPCGPVLPSAQFPGGLTHRSAPCTDYRAPLTAARTANWFPVVEAVRGIEAMRVSFTGAPTVAGEADAGTLGAFSVRSLEERTTTSSTGGSIGWVEQPYGGSGTSSDPNRGLPRHPPSAVWWFETTGDDSFDVASYTVDLHYLAAED